MRFDVYDYDMQQSRYSEFIIRIQTINLLNAQLNID